jgi:cell wall-associated NlpC family hydrolase
MPVLRAAAAVLLMLVLSAGGARVFATPTPQAPGAASPGDREVLLREIAKAWSGTPYRDHGTTFSGIGNAEFVREVYGALFDADLPGDPSKWKAMGTAVDKKALEPGDVILYDADPLSHYKKQLHAGVFIGDGQFVASVRGSGVSTMKLADTRWKTAYQGARRIASATALARSTARVAIPAHPVTDRERRLRDVESEWHGTPYKLGGANKAGIDCSAFARVVFKQVYAIDLPRTGEEQEAMGSAVSRSHLQAGDLVFFRIQGMGPQFSSRHVGVYLGAGEFAQASGSRGVTISRLDDPYWNDRYRTARRVLK